MNTKLSIFAVPLLASLVAQCGYFNSNNNSPTKPPPGIIAREHQFKRENVKSNSELIAAEGQENKQSQSDALNPISEIEQRKTSVSQVEEQIIENAPRQDTPVKIVQKPKETAREVVNVNVEECVNLWNNWKKTYTATNPIASMNKTSQYKTDERQMRKVLSGSSKIEFKPPLKVEGREHKNFRFSKRYIAENWYNDRNLKMRESISHLVKNNREDNLLIILAGLHHTLDYFLINKDQTSIYASYPFKEDTRFKTADHYQVLDYLGVEDEAELRGADQIALMLLGVYGQVYYQASLGNKLSLDQLEDQDVNTSSEIIISDFHAIRDYQLARDLPKSNCLNSLGYKSVTFAIEFGSLYAGSAYNFQAVWDKFELEKITGPSHMENIKKLSPSAYNLIKSGKAQIYPNILEILTKVKEWETAGIPVRYTGIE